MDAKNFEIGQRFKHAIGDIVEVIEENGAKLLLIESIGTFDYIDDDLIEYEI